MVHRIANSQTRLSMVHMREYFSQINKGWGWILPLCLSTLDILYSILFYSILFYSQRSLKLFFSKNFLLYQLGTTLLSPRCLMQSAVLLSLLLTSSMLFFISVIVFFRSDFFLFNIF